MSKRLAIERLTTMLSGIRGAASGYRVDLEGRVYPVLIPPDVEPSVRMPYGCVVNVGTGTYGDPDSSVIDRTFTLRLMFFLKETSSNRLQSDLAGRLADLEDDVLRVILLDPTLGGAVKLIRPIAQETASGFVPEEDYGELVITVELWQIVDVDSLHV